MGAYSKAYYLKNKARIHKQNRASHHRNKQKRKLTYKNIGRFRHVERTYNLSVEDYKALLEKQGYKCFICESAFQDKNYACVDHSHEDGHVRGILCHRCNSGLGMFQDSLELLTRACAYLEEK